MSNNSGNIPLIIGNHANHPILTLSTKKQDLLLTAQQTDGITYTISILELAKKLRITPNTNNLPKKCYE